MKEQLLPLPNSVESSTIPRPGRKAKKRLHRVTVVLLVLTLVGDAASLVLARLTSPLRPPIGAAGVGAGPQPVVLVAGMESDGRGFARLIAALERDHVPVLDFDPDQPGTQPLTYRLGRSDRTSPSARHAVDVAATVVQPAIEAALARAGYDPAHQPVDVVAHSAGGLLMRALIELPGGALEPNWADRVDDLVMVATPNHGSTFAAWFAGDHGFGPDLKPDSDFLRRLGTTEPPGEVYTAIGGEAWALNWYRHDLDGDGHRHGHDGAVPAESPAVESAPLTIEPRSHGQLLSDRRVIDRIRATLAAHA